MKARSPQVVALAGSAWPAVTGSLPLWRELQALGLLQRPADWALAAALTAIVASVLALVLGLLAWRRALRLVLTVLLLVTAATTHFLLSYHVVMDPGMATNVLQTDWHETGALLDGRFAAWLLFFAGLPIAALWRVPLRPAGWGAQLARNLLLAGASLLAVFLLVLAAFQPLASAMRNHKQLRYLLTPLNVVYAFGAAAAEPWRQHQRVLAPLGRDARLVATGPRPPLLVLVVGETGRSGNFGLNGYERDTTPELARLGVASWRNAWSCGTSTAASLPCMFSHLGREAYGERGTDHENLLDVLQHAGLAVLWVDNQSGCKGVCDRVPSASTVGDPHAALCRAGECQDEILLRDLDRRIAALPAERRARGVVLVLHPMGSHGPAYGERSPAAFKRFQPECRSVQLQDCSRASIVNAYDNSIAYTDHWLAATARWLQAREDQWDGALLYVADHGESLGENNLYLHGMPWSLAPDVQKRVPWITWLGAGFQQRSGLGMDCLRSIADRAVTHDHLFHGVLGLLQVRTAAYRRDRDPYADCVAH